MALGMWSGLDAKTGTRVAGLLGAVRARSLRCAVSGHGGCCAGRSSCLEVVAEAGICAIGDTPGGVPRQADVLVVTGAVTLKSAGVLRQSFDSMSEPRWVVAVGDCACTGGPFRQYRNVAPGASQVLPVDVSVEGCPPRPEQLREAIEKLEEMVRAGRGRHLDEVAP